MKNYEEITFSCGVNIEEAVKELAFYHKHGNLVKGDFNGQTLYSDVDDVDSAYKKIIGLSRKEYDEKMLEDHKKYEEEKRKHEEAIPALTIEWIEKGKEILDTKYHELWEKCVPIRLGDLYRGMELGCCLDIVKLLNSGESFELCKKKLEKQDHSGMSYGLVCNMLVSFSDKGQEFVDSLK